MTFPHFTASWSYGTDGTKFSYFMDALQIYACGENDKALQHLRAPFA